MFSVSNKKYGALSIHVWPYLQGDNSTLLLSSAHNGYVPLKRLKDVTFGDTDTQRKLNRGQGN